MNTSGQGVVQLTRAPLGEVEHLEWSPGNDRIAFVAKDITQETVQTQFGDAIGPFLYLINADGTGQRRLVDRPGEYYPTWSPDGMQILFYLLDHSTEKQLPAGFYVMNADGSSMRGVLAEGVCREPNWGRANNKLAFVCGQLPVMAPLILTADMQDLLK